MPNLQDRLKVYGIKKQDISLKNLKIKSGENIKLTASHPQANYKSLSTSSFDSVKQWIGLPDDIVKNEPELRLRKSIKKSIPVNMRSFLRPALSLTSRPRIALPTKLSPDQHRSAKVLANQYIYGDSRKISQSIDLLKLAYPKIIIGIIMLNVIEVESGATLEVGGDSNILFADKIIIHNGGKIKVQLGNSFKVDASTIEKV